MSEPTFPCWSCGAFHSASEVAEAGGYCPQCEADYDERLMMADLAQRYVALEAENERLRKSLAEVIARSVHETLAATNSAMDGYLAAGIAATDAELDTLRQQLSEANDDTNRWHEIACKQSKRADGLADQRDKLAGLLSFGHDHVVNARHDVEVRSMNGNEASTLVLAGIDQWLADIDAALAEVSK